MEKDGEWEWEASGRFCPSAILKQRCVWVRGQDRVESLQTDFVDKEEQTAATGIKFKTKLGGMFYNTTWLVSVRFVVGLTVT